MKSVDRHTPSQEGTESMARQPQQRFRMRWYIVAALVIIAGAIFSWYFFCAPSNRAGAEDKIILLIPPVPGSSYGGPFGLLSYSLKTGSTTPIASADAMHNAQSFVFASDGSSLIVAKPSYASETSTKPGFSLSRVNLISGISEVITTSSVQLMPFTVSADGSEIAYAEIRLASLPKTKPSSPNQSGPVGGILSRLYIPPQDAYLAVTGTHDVRDIAKNVSAITFSPSGRMLLGIADDRLVLVDIESKSQTPFSVPQDVELLKDLSKERIISDGTYIAISPTEGGSSLVGVIDWEGQRLSQTVTIPLHTSGMALARSRLLLLEPAGNEVTLHTYILKSVGENLLATETSAKLYPIPSQSFLFGWISSQ